MGVVSPVGEQGSVIAKIAALKAGWDFRVAGVQLNRFCASGLEAVNMAAQKVRSRLGRPGRRRRRREHEPRADRLGRRRLGAGPGDQLATGFVPQGIGADLIATLEGLAREDVDALRAGRRSSAPPRRSEGGFFDRSVVPVEGLRSA